jgi:hypothetical protein
MHNYCNKILKKTHVPSRLPNPFNDSRDASKIAFYTLRLIAETGISLKAELEDVLQSFYRFENNVSILKSALGKKLDNTGLVISENLPNPIHGHSIKALRLSKKGVVFCRKFGWKVTTSEWMQLINGHRGDEWKKHTSLVLYFCFQARKRGWQCELLPITSLVGVEPDILISKNGINFYVEAETKARNHLNKWKKANREQNYVAICTATPERRYYLIEEMRKVGVDNYYLTDLKTLVNLPSCNLWLEERFQ